MALAATQIFDSPGGPVQYHFTITGLTAGANVVNLVSLIGIQWPTNWVPTKCHVEPIFDGTHTVPSKLMYDPTTLTNSNIVIYCDASGSTSCELMVY